MNIYVGNLSYDANEDSLRELFSEYGTVTRARVVTDRETGRPRGFGFVEMASDEEAQKAIDALNGAKLLNRQLTVNEARPREQGGHGGGHGRDRDGGHRREGGRGGSY